MVLRAPRASCGHSYSLPPLADLPRRSRPFLDRQQPIRPEAVEHRITFHGSFHLRDDRAGQPGREVVVEELARRAQCSVEEAAAAYRIELAALESRAKVKQFVRVLASRYALARLRKH